jgi:predicted PurR-regulated permease PerM
MPAREVARIVAVALFVIAAAALLVLVVERNETAVSWLVAAIFLALALNPAVDLVQSLKIRGRALPRALAILVVFLAFAVFMFFLILHFIPPVVDEAERLGSKLPVYVKDFEEWAEHNEQFRELNDKYDITSTLSDQASKIPSHLGGAASDTKNLTVELLENLLAAITVLVLTFFLLIDGREQARRMIARLPAPHAERWQRIAGRIYGVVKGYVSVNLALAAVAGLFTWGMLELLGVDLALPLAVLVAFLDLIPLVGLTIAGILVAAMAALHGFPRALIIWLAVFLVYKQLQDRVIQPLLFRGVVQVHPVVAIIAILVGASIAGGWGRCW